MKPSGPYPGPGCRPDLSRPVPGAGHRRGPDAVRRLALYLPLVRLGYRHFVRFIRPIKEEWYANGAPFVNLVSSGLSIAGILCALYGLSSFEDYSASFWIGLVLLVVFVIHEGKSFHPLLPLYLFRNLTFSMSNLAALIQYSATYAVSFLLSSISRSFSPAAGCVRGHPAGAAHHHAFLSPRAGDLSDKYGPRGIASIGLVLTALGLTAFALFPRVPVSGAAIFLVFIGLGAALFGAPNNSAIMGSVKKMHHASPRAFWPCRAISARP